jgi:hypothetical protein
MLKVDNRCFHLGNEYHLGGSVFPCLEVKEAHGETMEAKRFDLHRVGWSSNPKHWPICFPLLVPNLWSLALYREGSDVMRRMPSLPSASSDSYHLIPNPIPGQCQASFILCHKTHFDKCHSTKTMLYTNVQQSTNQPSVLALPLSILVHLILHPQALSYTPSLIALYPTTPLSCLHHNNWTVICQ